MAKKEMVNKMIKACIVSRKGGVPLHQIDSKSVYSKIIIIIITFSDKLKVVFFFFFFFLERNILMIIYRVVVTG